MGPRLFLRNTVWWMGYRMNVIEGGKLIRKVYRESLGVRTDPSSPQAFQKAKDNAWGKCLARYAEVSQPEWIGHRAEKLTVEELLDTYLASKTRKNPYGMRYAVRFLRMAFGPCLANQFDYRLFLQWREKMEEAGYGHGTIDKVTRIFRAAFHLGHQMRLVHAVPLLPCYNEKDARQGFLEHEEFLALDAAIREASPDLSDLWQFGYYSGCRPSEAEELVWQNVSIEQKSVTFVDTKNGESRAVSLPQVWRIIEARMLQRHRDGQIVPWVFHRDGLPFDHNTRNHLFARARKEAGYPGRIWYDLRRTFYRNAINAGIPEVTVMAITGHKTRSMATRYGIRTLTDQWQAGERLARTLGAQSGQNPQQNRA